MNAVDVATAVLLTAGVAVVLVCAVGLLAGGSAFDRLHFLAPVSALAVPLVVTALALAQDHPGRATVKLVVIGLLLTGSGPVVTMATGRAATRDPGSADPESRW
ncbi:MAG TPA: monovalent cation/H(+) antiporter subunit G [Mycobacteriales bacterium]